MSPFPEGQGSNPWQGRKKDPQLHPWPRSLERDPTMGGEGGELKAGGALWPGTHLEERDQIGELNHRDGVAYFAWRRKKK